MPYQSSEPPIIVNKWASPMFGSDKVDVSAKTFPLLEKYFHRIKSQCSQFLTKIRTELSTNFDIKPSTDLKPQHLSQFLLRSPSPPHAGIAYGPIILRYSALTTFLSLRNELESYRCSIGAASA